MTDCIKRYYDIFMADHFDIDSITTRDDITDMLHTYCDETASFISLEDCILAINQMFDNQLNAIQEYINEYGDIPIYNNDIIRTYRILAYLAIHRYIHDKLDEPEPDIINIVDNVVLNDDERSEASTEEYNDSDISSVDDD